MSPDTPDDDVNALGALETALGVTFADRGLLLRAVTHRSFVNEADGVQVADNERLEYLGDALVDFIAADLLYRALPDAREGELTALRSHLVREDALAAFARELELPRYLRLGRGEDASGGRARSGLQCDVFEAVVGALFLDQGFAAAERLVMPFFRRELPQLLEAAHTKDAKSRLQELSQSRWQATPAYVTVEEHGPDHRKRFVVEVRVAGRAWGTGEGASKSAAAQAAAAEAIGRLGDPTRILDDAGANGGK